MEPFLLTLPPSPSPSPYLPLPFYIYKVCTTTALTIQRWLHKVRVPYQVAIVPNKNNGAKHDLPLGFEWVVNCSN